MLENAVVVFEGRELFLKLTIHETTCLIYRHSNKGKKKSNTQAQSIGFNLLIQNYCAVPTNGRTH